MSEKFTLPYLIPLNYKVEECIQLILVFFSFSIQFFWLFKYLNDNKEMKYKLYILIIIAFLWAYLRAKHL